jgi:hypothetical protein
VEILFIRRINSPKDESQIPSNPKYPTDRNIQWHYQSPDSLDSSTLAITAKFQFTAYRFRNSVVVQARISKLPIDPFCKYWPNERAH